MCSSALLESFWKPAGAFHAAQLSTVDCQLSIVQCRSSRGPQAPETLIVTVFTSRLFVRSGCPHDLALLVLTCQRVLGLVWCLRVFSPPGDVTSIVFRPTASWQAGKLTPQLWEMIVPLFHRPRIFSCTSLQRQRQTPYGRDRLPLMSEVPTDTVETVYVKEKEGHAHADTVQSS